MHAPVPGGSIYPTVLPPYQQGGTLPSTNIGLVPNYGPGGVLLPASPTQLYPQGSGSNGGGLYPGQTAGVPAPSSLTQGQSTADGQFSQGGISGSGGSSSSGGVDGSAGQKGESGSSGSETGSTDDKVEDDGISQAESSIKNGEIIASAQGTKNGGTAQTQGRLSTSLELHNMKIFIDIIWLQYKERIVAVVHSQHQRKPQIKSAVHKLKLVVIKMVQ